MTAATLEEVLAAVLADRTLLADYVVAKAEQERASKGWVPGKSYVLGTYVNGKKVSA